MDIRRLLVLAVILMVIPFNASAERIAKQTRDMTVAGQLRSPSQPISLPSPLVSAAVEIEELITFINTIVPHGEYQTPQYTGELTQKLSEVLGYITHENKVPAVEILSGMSRTTDGCRNLGRPDFNDLVRDCATQEDVHSAIYNAISFLLEAN